MKRSTNRRPTDCDEEVSTQSRVDVLVAARDRADTIERAVLSALAQEEVRAVIVVDDGSADDTAARARQCDPDGKRVIIERLPVNRGPATARNVAINISDAPWMAILDADDYFVPGRIGGLLAHSDEGDFVADDVMHVAQARATYELSIAASFAEKAGKPLRLTFADFVRGNVSGGAAIGRSLAICNR